MVQLKHSSQKNDRIHADMKLPPHSIEAEQSVLGGLMLSDAAWEKVCNIVKEDDFYRQDHRLIFKAIAIVRKAGQPADVVTLGEILEKSGHGNLEKAGGMLYLGTLAKDTPSAANVEAYARIVRERSILREIIQIGEKIASTGYTPGLRDLSEIIGEIQSSVAGLTDVTAVKPVTKISTLVARAIDLVDERCHSDRKLIGISTGFSELDELTLGIEKKDLWIVAGRPSMGKTAFVFNIAEHVGWQEKLPVVAFSMEMGEDQVGLRSLASVGRLSGYCLRKGIMEDNDWPKVTAASSILSETELYIDDRPALTVSQIESRCTEFKRLHGRLGLVIVDYLQLMTAENPSNNRANDVGEFSRGLKAIAKKLDVPVIALSQLNRSLEQRPNKRPQMSDLRESGAIEQDADLIAFLYRDEVYNPDTPDKGICEVLIRKQRNGPLGDIKLTSKLHMFRFHDYTPERSEPEATASRYANKGAPD